VGVARTDGKRSRVLLIDRATHRVRASAGVDGTVRSAPLVWQGSVFVVNDEGTVTGLRVEGEAFRDARTLALGPGVRVSAPPALADGVLYVGDSSGALHALDVRPSQIERLYEFRIPGTDRKPAAVTTRPAVAGDWILFGAADNAVYGLRR
jgi:outer membrane protein assembly factor BamB